MHSLLSFHCLDWPVVVYQQSSLRVFKWIRRTQSWWSADQSRRLSGVWLRWTGESVLYNGWRLRSVFGCSAVIQCFTCSNTLYLSTVTMFSLLIRTEFNNYVCDCLNYYKGKNNYENHHQSVSELLINISMTSLCSQRAVQQSQRSMLTS